MKRLFSFMLIAMMAASLGLVGCSGDDGSNGKTAYQLAVDNGYVGTEQEWLASLEAPAPVAAALESCGTCHNGAGDQHQAQYNDAMDTTLSAEFFAPVVVDNGDGTFATTVTFHLTKAGQPYTAAIGSNGKIVGLEQESLKWLTYDAATNTFPTTGTFANNSVVSDGNGDYHLVATLNFDITAGDADVYGYFTQNPIGGPVAGHVQLYGEVANAGYQIGSWTYSSASTIASCENCHGAPYLKHGYRGAAANGLDDFVACKNCHFQANGADGAEFFGDASYVYTKDIMTDVHASHNNLFPYPQSMANCATCHPGAKLASTLSAANFKLEVCKTCHADVDAATNTVVKLPLSVIVPAGHPADVRDPSVVCATCHGDAGALSFLKIHTGYDSKIATAAGVRYSDAFQVTVDAAALTGNVLDIQFSATNPVAVTGLTTADISPTVLVGLYGYDTHNFVVSPHNRDLDADRNLEYVVGATSARFTTVASANGSWEVTADLGAWADKIADGTIKRLEIAIMPKLVNAAGDTVALDAPSRTFDIAANAFDDAFFGDIVKVADGCNKCHDALATSFHSGDRGGNIVVCRLCHTVNNGGSHLEMQGRSIDSYVHAIHAFQQFDVKNIDFFDPAQAAKYEEEIGFVYPTFSTLACESCHNAGTYNVPDQSKSLPGILSGSAVNATWNRNIGTVPSYVVGPASRACGSCHRAQMINEDQAGALASFNQHTMTFGTLIENADGVLASVTATVMAMFQ